MLKLIKLIAVCLLFCWWIGCKTNPPNWQPLWTDDLSNFQQLNGTAEYRLEDGILIGTSKANTPNSFLATKQNYADFILEFEVLIDDSLNSGVQFRSLSTSDYENGRVHGYQAEIDPSPRKWAGGIYDEARRGWLYPLKDHPEGQAAFQNGEWNQYRIEAISDTLRVFVNEINTANLIDTQTTSGFIAFQVHSIGRKSLVGREIRWRNARVLTKNVGQFKKNKNKYAPIVKND